jgi:hypothetical protein
MADIKICMVHRFMPAWGENYCSRIYWTVLSTINLCHYLLEDTIFLVNVLTFIGWSWLHDENHCPDYSDKHGDDNMMTHFFLKVTNVEEIGLVIGVHFI